MKRKQYDGKFKARVVLEALKEQQTVSEIASHFRVHPNVVTKWKRHAMANLADLFCDRHERERQDMETLQQELYQQIGQLTMEVDWLKKKSGLLSG
jgi:transposase-like protein